MAEMVYNCPHCHAESVGFVSQVSHQRSLQIRGLPSWNALFVCRRCQDSIVVKLFNQKGSATAPHSIGGDPQDFGFVIDSVYPAPQSIDIPDHVPGDIQNDYVEAETNLKRQAFISAGIMFRRVLDRVTKKLAPEAQDQPLNKRIAHLAKANKISPEVSDLADFIRQDGNVAAHEEEFDKGQALKMRNFTYLFLLSVYTIPGLVERAREPSPIENNTT